MATRYRLTVNIEESLLPSYNNKTEPYTLCIAKKVGEDYNVVFQCRSTFLCLANQMQASTELEEGH